jgi:hypothetical protein
MPRAYIRKKVCCYSSSDPENTLKCIRENSLTVADAGRIYHITRATFNACLSNHHDEGKPDAKTILSILIKLNGNNFMYQNECFEVISHNIALKTELNIF